MKQILSFMLLIFFVNCLAFDAPAQTCSPPAPNMVSWWRAEGNASDARNANNGTLQGATFAAGRVGQAFNFDGIDDAISLGNNSSLQPVSMTAEAWIYKTSLPGAIEDVFTKWGGDATLDSHLFGVINDGGQLRAFGAIGDGVTGDGGLWGGTSISLNAWTHLAMTYNQADGSHKLYVNGVEVISRVRPNGVFAAAATAYIGREDSGFGRYFKGLIDELAFYNRALSQSEIQQIFNAGSAGKCYSGGQSNGNFSQKQKLQPNTLAGSRGFGNAAAISGDTMVVGASGYDTTLSTEINRGAAYVFVRANGVWTQQAQLLASDGLAGDEFGYSVAISGDTIVVGALKNDVAANSNAGAAYVFVRSGTTWTQQQKLLANDGAADDEFGNAVAVSGNTVAVGAHFSDQPSGGGAAGAVYVFNRSGAAWTQAQKLIPTGTVLFGDSLGESIALSGDTLVAGAAGDQEPNRTNRGTVYVYTRSGSTFTAQQKLIVPDTQPSTQLGFSVAIDVDTIVSGAIGDTPVVSQPNQGAAYVFARSGGSWTLQQRLTASDAAQSDYFGTSVAVRGNTLAVSARFDDTSAGADAGGSYVFTRSGTTWTERQKLAPTDAAAGDRFGVSQTLGSDGTLVVGAADKNLPMGQGNGAGAVYVFNQAKTALFDFDADGKSDISVFRPSNGIWYLQQSTNGFTGAQFGAANDKLVPADYDGDGKTDLAVFRPSTGEWYLQRSTAGFAVVPFGSTNDLPRPGDFDGDGKADVAVFRPSSGLWYLSRSQLGFTAVSFGSNGDAPLVADFDADGKSDLAVFRPSSGIWYWTQSSDGNFRGAQFGISTDIPVPADFDGDGKTDLAVFRPSNGFWYWLRSSNGAFDAAQFGLSGDKPLTADFDGDGLADLAVFRAGNWYWRQSANGQFSAYPFGTATDLPVPAAFLP